MAARSAAARAAGVAISIVPLLFAGCGHGGSDATTFRFNLASGVASLDPAAMNSVAAGLVGIQLFDGLVKLDTAGRIVPALARSWSIGADGTTYRFVLRRDVRFHDDPCFAGGVGRAMTAADVAFSFTRVCDPRVTSTGWWVFHLRIVGADAFHEAPERVGAVAGFSTEGDSVFVLRLVRPFAPMLALLTTPYGFVVPPEAVAHYGAEFFAHPVGTGAFRFDRWTPDVELVLARSGHDWRGAHGTIATVHVAFARDAKTEFLEFTRGALDLATAVPQGFEDEVFDSTGALRAAYARDEAVALPAMTTEYYGILLDTGYEAARATPLASQVLVRRALNYAIDREAIVRYVVRGGAIAGRGVLPPGMPGYDPHGAAYPYDPDRALALLAEAGYPHGRGLPALTLGLGTSEQTASVAEAVQEQLARVGVHLKLQQVDFPQLLEMIRAGRLALWRTQWVADYCDPENFLALFASANVAPGGPNTTRYANAEVDALYEHLLDPALDDAHRRQLSSRMDSLIVADAPWIVLYYPRTTRLLQPGIRNFACDPLGRFALADVVK